VKILVVGGGTAGLIAATIINKFLKAEVSVVRSSKIGIVGVGEGSTEHFSHYMNFLGISPYDMIKRCDATYKAGILFDGWSKDPYLHYVGQQFSERVAQYNYLYGYEIGLGEGEIVSQSILDGQIESWFLNKQDSIPFNQFHFNTYKLNKYLEDFSVENGIEIIDDEVLDVIVNESGNIDSVVGEKEVYRSDFYIDATGFKKILIGKMGAKWKSFGEHLRVDSAIVFPSEQEEDIRLYTRAKAMNSGWCFTLPVWDRRGNGYIFDSRHTSLEEAKEEVFNIFGDVSFGKEFHFDPGYLENSWINNCASVGLSSAFVEPLEATSIGTTIQQSFMLMQKITNYSEKDIKDYNKKFKLVMENIRDFIFLHYMTKKTNSEFWKEVSGISAPDSLQEKINIWHDRLPRIEDFHKDSEYSMFNEKNFILVMHGMNMIDKEKIKKEFNSLNPLIESLAKEKMNSIKEYNKLSKKISHRKMLEIIREVL
jgi:tryptophan halogenase